MSDGFCLSAAKKKKKKKYIYTENFLWIDRIGFQMPSYQPNDAFTYGFNALLRERAPTLCGRDLIDICFECGKVKVKVFEKEWKNHYQLMENNTRKGLEKLKNRVGRYYTRFD
jgi:hypothetical protein